MTEIGYKLSSEEHDPNDLVRNARRAEEAGFAFALISDHFHPWIDRQGHSPFVWSVIGGIAHATTSLRLGTGVTAPTVRIHPAVIAQAAATSAAMMPGRFLLGVGSGENLNEHILGDRWPPTSVRLEMLEEAIEVIRLLWEGGNKSHHGKHYIVENARIYDLPDERPPIAIAAAGPKAARLAGRMGDALVSTAPDEEVITTFDEAGGAGKPRYAEVQVCWAADEDEALDIATEWWPNVDVPGELGQELPVPRHFEQAAENADRGRIADKVSCGPDPEKHLDGIRKFVDAGFDHICVHQIGPDQEGFFEFYERHVLPKLG
jgi:coenzyme F420-dependent glucose-6-phosphate dehydrogenase